MRMVIIICTIFLALLAMTAARGEQAAQRTVVVQLFTSEGCSSCPSADALLAEYAKASPIEGVTVVPMALHVDYWNHLGWRDEFSSPSFTAYQKQYKQALNAYSLYTPQMVVDGKVEFVGSNRAAAIKAIKDAADAAKAQLSIRLKVAEKDANILHATVDLQERDALPKDQTFNIVLAVTEDDLTTKVQRGENTGRTLHHAAVVRSFKQIGQVSQSGDPKPMTADLTLDPKWKRDRLHVIAFIQSTHSLSIHGAATTNLAMP